MRFVDTNVLIYAVSTADEEAAKRNQALNVLAARDLALSVQVLQEFYVQSTRESRPGALSRYEAASFVESLQRFRVQAVTMGVLRAAFSFRERFRLSYWDSAHSRGRAHLRLRHRLFRRPEPRPGLRRRAGNQPLRLSHVTDPTVVWSDPQ